MVPVGTVMFQQWRGPKTLWHGACSKGVVGGEEKSSLCWFASTHGTFLFHNSCFFKWSEIPTNLWCLSLSVSPFPSFPQPLTTHSLMHTLKLSCLFEVVQVANTLFYSPWIQDTFLFHECLWSRDFARYPWYTALSTWCLHSRPWQLISWSNA